MYVLCPLTKTCSTVAYRHLWCVCKHTCPFCPHWVYVCPPLLLLAWLERVVNCAPFPGSTSEVEVFMSISHTCVWHVCIVPGTPGGHCGMNEYIFVMVDGEMYGKQAIRKARPCLWQLLRTWKQASQSVLTITGKVLINITHPPTMWWYADSDLQ